MITLSYGIKISVVYCLVLSQSTRVTDRQTERRTDTDRQNYDSQDRASIGARAVKKLEAPQILMTDTGQ